MMIQILILHIIITDICAKKYLYLNAFEFIVNNCIISALQSPSNRIDNGIQISSTSFSCLGHEITLSDECVSSMQVCNSRRVARVNGK